MDCQQLSEDEIFAKQRLFAFQLRASSSADRCLKLRKLDGVLRRRHGDIIQALAQDFSKPSFETLLTEIFPLHAEINFILKNLDVWMRPQRVKTPWMLLGSRSEIQMQPRGTCLIIAPWNYPFYLSFAPLIAAIAAGNTVFLKPSEMTPATGKLIQEICQEVFAPEQVTVVLGGKELSERLLKLPFDHIFFTGSTQVGKVILRAAAETLATVTLELGGKSPTIIDETSDLELAARRIAWGKSVNAGQTCVAPDYVFIHRRVMEEFKSLYIQAISAFYIDAQTIRKDFAHVINQKHRDRLHGLIQSSSDSGFAVIKINQDPWGEASSQQVQPTMIDLSSPEGIPWSLPILQEEIFGPILPIIPFVDIEEVIRAINSQPKPLALYIFSKNQQLQKRLLQETSSGGAVINDIFVHLLNPHLPFGGVNESGHGKYHGQFGFRAFSHERAVLRQGIFSRLLKYFYPPYTSWKKKLIELLVATRFS